MANAWIKGNLQVTQNESSFTIKILGGRNQVKIGNTNAKELAQWIEANIGD